MTELILNPNLTVGRLWVADRVTGYSVVAAVKGRGRLRSTVEIADADPNVIDVLAGLTAADADIEISENAWSALIDLGVLIQEHEVSRPVKFSCRLEGDIDLAAAARMVNAEFEVVALASLVAEEEGLERVVEPASMIALVTDPVTGARLPYWIENREQTVLQRLTPGDAPPPDLDDTDLRRLVGAGIVLDRNEIAVANLRVASAATRFGRHRCAEFSKVLPPLQVAALRSYYRDLLGEGHVARRDRQVPLRSGQHSEPMMQYFHHQLSSLFSRIVQRPLKPSYAYFASCRRGARLERHRDREQCAFTASLLLDYVVGPGDDPMWPLYLELPETGEEVGVALWPGDCVLFAGCELPHHRRELRGECSTSLLLHYVDDSFAGNLQ